MRWRVEIWRRKSHTSTSTRMRAVTSTAPPMQKYWRARVELLRTIFPGRSPLGHKMQDWRILEKGKCVCYSSRPASPMLGIYSICGTPYELIPEWILASDLLNTFCLVASFFLNNIAKKWRPKETWPSPLPSQVSCLLLLLLLFLFVLGRNVFWCELQTNTGSFFHLL